MGLNLKCPRCGKMMTLEVSSGMIQCKHCGYAPINDSNAIRAADPPKRKRRLDLENVGITSRHKPTARQESLFYKGITALKRGDREAAQRHFKEALRLDKAFTDPWLWLTSITDDPAEQRQYLEWVLGYEPDNLRAIEAMALLAGRLKPEDLTHDPTERLAPGEHVEATAKQMTCPQCGGRLTYDVVRQLVVCWNCNYQETIEASGSGGRGMLAEALLKRKYKFRRWHAAERILTCDHCGATVTLSARTMTDRCTFCNSQRVLISDNAETFEQPDSIVPFKVTEEQAIEGIRKAISSGLRGLMRFFRDPISHDEARGIYVPFWAFDALAEVSWSYPGTPYHGKEAIMMDDVLICASDSLDRELIGKMQPFDMRRARKYDPRYLADWPAEIYRLDVDEASLHARQEISRTAGNRARTNRSSTKYHKQQTGFGHDDQVDIGKLHVSPAYISGMTYRLVLVPVWVVLLHEEDGDVRRNLVNGQTGKVAVGGRLGGLL